MNLKKKTDAGTIGAFYTSDGVSVGVVDGEKGKKILNGVALLEAKDGELQLVLFDGRLSEYGIKVVHE